MTARLLCLLLLAAGALHAADQRVEQMPERYRRWLEREVVWIITPDEREAYLEMRSDAERDRFVRDFWQARDPDPVTALNEFRQEHERRLAYADRYLGTGSPRPGRLTDRGRVYILLGPPNDIQRVVSHNEVYPHELWTYHNTSRYGLPGTINLLFYRANGLGEFRLYNPVLDRDRLFPPTTQILFNDFYELRNALGVDFARATESVAPGMSQSSSADIVHELSQPREIPQRILDRGRELRTAVRTRWSLDSFEVHLGSATEQRDDGSLRLHLALVVPPEALNAVEDEQSDSAGLRLEIIGSIRDQRGLEVARFAETASAKLPRSELAERGSHAFAFEAVRELIPGRYTLDVTVQDFVSQAVGRIERQLVLAPAGSEQLWLEGPWLGFKLEPATHVTQPWAFAGLKLAPRAPARFAVGETLRGAALAHVSAQLRADGRALELSIELLRDGEPVRSRSAALETPETEGRRAVALELPSEGLAPGVYELRVTLRHPSGASSSASSRLELSGRPPYAGLLLHEEQRQPGQDVAHFNRGLQYLSRMDLDSAARHFRLSLDHNMRFLKSLVYLARVELLRGRTDAAATLLAEAREIEPRDHELLATLGSLRLARGEWAAARDALEQALESGPRTPETLNALGLALSQLEQPEAALMVFEESLTAEPRQPAIAERVEQLKQR